MTAHPEHPDPPAGEPFEVRRDDTTVTVAVRGPIDLETVSSLRVLLIDVLVDGCRDLVLDLARTTFVDSLGLGTLVSVWKRARVLRTRVVVWRPAEPVVRALSLTGLDQLFKPDHDPTRHPVEARSEV